MKLIKYIPIILLSFILGCSDNNSPTNSGGGNAAPSISVSDKTALEGQIITFTISLNKVISDDVTFMYATTNGSAVSGQSGDYIAVSGSDTISAGASSVTIQVNTINDGTLEKAESFSFIISMSTNASISVGEAFATIYDNDGVSFSSSIKPIIQSNNCLNSGCHGTGSSSGGFSFGSASYNSVKNASGIHGKIVFPDNAATSNLYLKLLSSPPFGDRMPKVGSFLSTTNINKIKDWINQGAQDN